MLSFDPALGRSPRALMLASDGNLYGMTFSAGPSGGGSIFRIVIND
jgi:uncharacterized repeat protein (TIGR03803 family)